MFFLVFNPLVSYTSTDPLQRPLFSLCQVTRVRGWSRCHTLLDRFPKAAYPFLQTIMSTTQGEVAGALQRRQSLPHTQAAPLDFMATLIVATK